MGLQYRGTYGYQALGNGYGVMIPNSTFLPVEGTKYKYVFTQTNSYATLSIQDELGNELASGMRNFSYTNQLGTQLAIFCRYKENNSYFQGWIGRMYNSFTINDLENNLLAEFVPCYRKVDLIAGLYDRVSGQFYTGTSNFIVGPDVNT